MKHLIEKTTHLSLGLFGLMCLGLLHILPTGAFFSDQVLGTGTFEATSLEIDLSETEPFAPDTLLPSDTTTAKMLLSNIGGLDFKYNLNLSPTPDSDLCENLDIQLNYLYYDNTDNLITEPLYTGTIDTNNFVGGPGLMQLPNAIPFQPNTDYTITQHWLEIEASLPFGADPNLQNQNCQFQLIASAWQANLAQGQGFTDTDSLNFSLSSGNWEVCEPGDAYAENIIATQGKRKNGSNVLAARSDTESVKGPADGVFYSLGFVGEMILEFEYPLENGAGNDLVITEITNGRSTYPEELASVEISQDGTNWVLLGTATSKVANGLNQFDFADVGMPWIRYVRLTDTSNYSLFPNDGDGFDIDTVFGNYGTCFNPTNTCSLISGVVSESLEQTPLENQTIALLRPGTTPVETLTLMANSPTAQSIMLEDGKTYLFEATGVWTNQNGVRKVDAGGYFSNDNWSTWDEFRNTPGRDPKQLTISIDGEFVEWGSYNPDHRYKILVEGQGETVDLVIYDGDQDPNPTSWYNDNAGSLTVHVYDVTDSLEQTDEAGRYQFESCVPGTHQLVWLSQDNFSLDLPANPGYYHFDLLNLPGSVDFSLDTNPYGDYQFNSPLTVNLYNLYGFSQYQLDIEYIHMVDEQPVVSGMIRGGVVESPQLSLFDFTFETCSDQVCVPQSGVEIIEIKTKVTRSNSTHIEFVVEENE